jgi:hypothetical protein
MSTQAGTGTIMVMMDDYVEAVKGDYISDLDIMSKITDSVSLG